MAFLILSGYAYAQYGYPGDPYGSPTICYYDEQGYSVFCNDQDGYNYYYYGHGPDWGGKEEHQLGEHREYGPERGERRKTGEHHNGHEQR